MPPRRYQPALNRQQEMILPPRVDDYVSQSNSVRAIDVYVNSRYRAADGARSAPYGGKGCIMTACKNFNVF
ncbi:MAG: hypothetical protein EPN89_19105 [Methylovulum sp.]|nr:MAG: hypothetical protein EPN89_19105 [Methylovulum sp.]